MKKFIKENWFKIIVLIILMWIVIFWTYEKIQNHNRMVLNDMYRNCSDKSEKSAETCVGVYMKQYIPPKSEIK